MHLKLIIFICLYIYKDMEDLYDYKIIHIDSSTATYNSSTTHDFYVSLAEPLRNVFKINIITSLVNIPNSATTLNASLEPIYIDFNNYNRLISNYSKTINGIIYKNEMKFFDSIIIENVLSQATGNIYKNDYNSSDSIYYLNPIEPQFNRINIRLIDKNNDVIPTVNITKFIMKIGVYYNNKKTTRI
jgi:hypothetical protein